MQVKTIVFDMDGTVLNHQKEMDKTLVACSQALQAQGLQLIIASGRLDFMTFNYVSELGIQRSPIVGCNGALIRYFQQQEPLYVSYLPEKLLQQLIQKSEELHLLFHIFTTEGLIGLEHAGRLAYYSDANESKKAEEQVPIFVGAEYLTTERLRTAVKFLVVSENQHAVQAFIAYARGLGLEVVGSGDGLTDVTMPGETKGKGLTYLDTLGIIDLETTMAFGDNYNDISMLEVVKYPIVMENAEADIKKYAYDVCGTNEANGVGKYLEKHFLK